ncbi:MAG: ATP-dependent DNA helicase [Deltaproteobacteria bacterium]|jgi:ATP-dependent DNA helicase DinG|nr:ATP-dependent DNA helicase [Deltaproteobacteria bacterium]
MAASKHPLPKELPADPSKLDYLLVQGGPLEEAWEGFEARDSQQVMFREATRTFKHGGTTVIEAGTGTGKTLAYLLPALISGKKTFVSTALKNLQVQILTKDLRFIREHFERDFKASVLKGRQNYVCLRLLDSIGMRVRKPKERETYAFIREWAEETETGEVDDLYELGLVDKEPPFDRISSSSENCLGQTCRNHDRCFVTRIRKKACESDIVLINHHLFMADLAMKGRGAVGFLPPWEAAIIDEAHMLENIASDYFSYKSATDNLQNTGKSLEQAIAWELGKEGGAPRGYESTLNDLRELSESIEDDINFISNTFHDPMEESLLWPKLPEAQWERKHRELKLLLIGLKDKLSEIIDKLDVIKDNNDDFKLILSDLLNHFEALKFITNHDDEDYVYQVKSDKTSVELAAVPIDISPFLYKHLFGCEQSILLCSATLSCDGKLDYFLRKTGIKPNPHNKVLKSPFDYEKNVTFYVPLDRELDGQPKEDEERVKEYDDAIAERIAQLLKITEGRALVLFTSFRQLNNVRHRLQSAGNLGYRLLWQDRNTSKSALLDIFKRDTNSVLLGTQSFWQGVDIPGESLSAVIIDKIPFPRPNTPLVQAKIELIEKNNGNGFNDYFMPEASLSLKQGLGRLIRNKSDWGLLAILDSRLHHTSYGPSILTNVGFPAKILTCRITDIERFFNEKNANG